MDKIIARNILSWLELLISHYYCISLVVYIIYISLCFLRLAKQSQFIPLQNFVYLITLPFLVRKIFTFYINDVYYLNIHFQCQRVQQRQGILFGVSSCLCFPGSSQYVLQILCHQVTDFQGHWSYSRLRLFQCRIWVYRKAIRNQWNEKCEATESASVVKLPNFMRSPKCIRSVCVVQTLVVWQSWMFKFTCKWT